MNKQTFIRAFMKNGHSLEEAESAYTSVTSRWGNSMLQDVLEADTNGNLPAEIYSDEALEKTIMGIEQPQDENGLGEDVFSMGDNLNAVDFGDDMSAMDDGVGSFSEGLPFQQQQFEQTQSNPLQISMPPSEDGMGQWEDGDINRLEPLAPKSIQNAPLTSKLEDIKTGRGRGIFDGGMDFGQNANPYGYDLESNLFMLGKAIGQKPTNPQERLNKGLEIAGRGGKALLGGSRNFLSGLSYSKANQRAEEWMRNRMSQRIFTPVRMTRNTQADMFGGTSTN